MTAKLRRCAAKSARSLIDQMLNSYIISKCSSDQSKTHVNLIKFYVQLQVQAKAYAFDMHLGRSRTFTRKNYKLNLRAFIYSK